MLKKTKVEKTNAEKKLSEAEELKALKKLKRKCWFVRHFVPIQKNKIVFSQFGGKGYGCNPKAICDELLKRKENYDLVWIIGKSQTSEKAKIPNGVRTVSGDDAIYELLTAKVWINNIHFNVLIDRGLVKRKGTIYLNTFHGGITLKNEGRDKASYNENRALGLKEQMYQKDSEFVDYITSGCEMEEHVLKEFFYGHGEILRLGDARTDILINGSREAEAKVRNHYKIPEGTKIAIFAPTFRSDMKLNWYDMNYNAVINTLEEVYGCPWVMLIRLHPRLAGKAKKIVPPESKFINASDYVDMQELEVASDLMISDYSSVLTDFMLTRRPAFMYVPDLENYIKSRGLYFKMEELPFSYAQNSEDLITCIKEFNLETYVKKANQFIKKIGYIDDGKSSERVVDFLLDKMR